MTLLMREQEKFEEGFSKGIEQGIIKQINALKEFNVPKEKIIDKIVLDYNLTEEEVRRYF